MPEDFLEYASEPKWLGLYNPMHIRDVMEEDYNHKSSCGMFFKSRGYKTQKDVYDDPKARQLIRNTAHLIKIGKPVAFKWFVCVVDAKRNLDTGEIKSRVAWVPDLTLLIIEKMFALPVIKDIPEPPSPLTCHRFYCQDRSYGLDFTSFDSTVPSWLIKCAFQKLFERFDLSMYTTGDKVYAHHSLQRLINVIIHNFIYSRFRATHCKTEMRKQHGVPSGSAFTYVINSIITHMVHTYLHRRNGCLSECKTHGDDIYYTGCSCPLFHVVGGYSSIGLDVKVEMPNSHGCLTYAKEECHNGIPFHPGQWYRNILNCIKDVRYLAEVVYGLILMSHPTELQTRQLIEIMVDEIMIRGYDVDLVGAPPWVKNLLTHGVPDRIQ